MTTSLTRSIRLLDSVYRSQAFLKEFEDHLPSIINSGKFGDIGVDPATALKFAGDFNGLMQELGHAPNIYYPSMRLTGLTNSTDFTGHNPSIRVIDVTYYKLLTNTWRTHRRQK